MKDWHYRVNKNDFGLNNKPLMCTPYGKLVVLFRNEINLFEIRGIHYPSCLIYKYETGGNNFNTRPTTLKPNAIFITVSRLYNMQLSKRRFKTNSLVCIHHMLYFFTF